MSPRSDRRTDAESVLSPKSYTNNNTQVFVRDPTFSSPSKIPRKIFRYLYSISLLIFVLLTSAFVLVTPIDIIVQTWGSPSTGLKTLIVIGACAVFLFISMIIYFLRLYQSRVALNQIPSKSVYIPLEKNDLPKDVINYIDSKLRWCIGEVRVKAGPLEVEPKINHPGMSPPEYIQKRNEANGYPYEGTLFPPACIYEDLVDALSLKLRLDGLLVINLDIPKNYSFREIILAMVKLLIDEQDLDPRLLPNVQQMITLYEKFKFSPELIKEDEMASFLVSFERLTGLYNVNRDAKPHDLSTSQRRSHLKSPSKFFESQSRFNTNDNLLAPSSFGDRRPSSGFTSGSQSGTTSGIRTYRGSTEDSSSIHHFRPLTDHLYNPVQFDSDRGLSSRQSTSSNGSFRNRNNSVKSTGSVVRNRLAFNLRGHTNSRATFEGSDSEGASRRRFSGYISDTEDDRHSKY